MVLRRVIGDDAYDGDEHAFGRLVLMACENAVAEAALVALVEFDASREVQHGGAESLPVWVEDQVLAAVHNPAGQGVTQ